MSWTAAINGGFVLFLLPGVIKAIAAAYLGIFLAEKIAAVKRESSKRGLLQAIKGISENRCFIF